MRNVSDVAVGVRGRGRELVGLPDLRPCRTVRSADLGEVIVRVNGQRNRPRPAVATPAGRDEAAGGRHRNALQIAHVPHHIPRVSEACGAGRIEPGVWEAQTRPVLCPKAAQHHTGTGQPRYPGHLSFGPEALRPCLSAGLPLSRTSRRAVCTRMTALQRRSGSFLRKTVTRSRFGSSRSPHGRKVTGGRRAVPGSMSLTADKTEVRRQQVCVKLIDLKEGSTTTATCIALGLAGSG